MAINIDIDKIIDNMDINDIVREHIISKITESSKLEDIVDNILTNNDVRNFIDKKIVNIIQEYMHSEDGKRYIVEKFNEEIDNSDIWTDDKIIELIAEFLKSCLIKDRCEY